MVHTVAVRRLLLGTLLGLAAMFSRSETPDRAPYPDNSWAEPSPASTGWSAEKLEAADNLARGMGTDAYLVVHRGVVVHRFGDITRPMNLASARKSVLSVLYGIEFDRGQVDLDNTLDQLGITDIGGLSDQEKTATVRQLLESRSGVYHLAAYETPFAKLERPRRGSHDPGTFWYYNNWDFNALGSIFQKFSGQSVFEALDRELAQPLGFEDFNLKRDTKFIFESSTEHPAYVMRLSARDMARIGLMLARGGRWQGRQIVSPGWIAESTTAYSPTGQSAGYGYLWWVSQNNVLFGQKFPAHVYSAFGNFGQFLLVDPVDDLVVVHHVDMDKLLKRQVSSSQFGALVARIQAAMP
jgi:CubicO group peptidase (beta-lactamase class C family)